MERVGERRERGAGEEKRWRNTGVGKEALIEEGRAGEKGVRRERETYVKRREVRRET